MDYPLEPVDCEGNHLYAGDSVIYVHVTDHLLHDLPMEDQEAILAQKGKIFRIVDFNDYGKAEFEFEHKHKNPDSIIYHTIWVEPNCLRKLNS